VSQNPATAAFAFQFSVLQSFAIALFLDDERLRLVITV
jgi:hypothetical protein